MGNSSNRKPRVPGPGDDATHIATGTLTIEQSENLLHLVRAVLPGEDQLRCRLDALVDKMRCSVADGDEDVTSKFGKQRSRRGERKP